MHLNKTNTGRVKVNLLIICLLPFIALCFNAWADNLGANPVEKLHFTLGDWALRFLCLTLMITPCRKITGQHWLSRFRRMFGLYVFFYATMHLLVYLALDLGFSWQAFLLDINETPYILFGLATFILILPLAVTSSNAMQKRLGRNWKKIHYLIYPAAITAILHYFLLVKSDLTEPLIYAFILFFLLTYRLKGKIIKTKRFLC